MSQELHTITPAFAAGRLMEVSGNMRLNVAWVRENLAERKSVLVDLIAQMIPDGQLLVLVVTHEHLSMRCDDIHQFATEITNELLAI